MSAPTIKNNERYLQMEVKPGEYLPDIGIDYPVDDPYASLVEAKFVRDLKFDGTYPYLEDSFSFRMQRNMAYFLVNGPYYWVNRLRYDLHFEGREILEKYKNELSNGAVIVSNHCYPWDGMAISECLKKRLWVPMLAKHFNTANYWHLRYFGGIPVPENYDGLKEFNKAFDTIHERKGWILVFPEARNWHFYKPVRPFRKGALTMAYKYNITILPMCITYRERTGIFKLFAPAEHPLLTVRIGEPIFPDATKPRKDEVNRLIEDSHAAVCSLAGIVKNSWPAFWNE